MKPPNLFIFAGESSGDLHGGYLLKALKQYNGSILATGVAGPSLRSEGMVPIMQMEEFEVMGLGNVLKALPKLWKNFGKVRYHILTSKPEIVILIDYPGFNLRLAKSLREKGFAGKIVQYVSPSIWAHSRKRIEQMAATLDMLLAIYPFEPPYFLHTHLKVEYIGNPIVEYIKNHSYENQWTQKLGIPSSQPLLALFPGSRPQEIKRHLPPLLEAAELLKKKNPDLIFALSCCKSEQFNPSSTSLKLDQDLFLVPKKYTYEMMRDSRAAIAKSGTVTLELALHGCPTVVFYKLSILDRLYAKYILQLQMSHYCIVNILEGRRIFPELIEKKFTPQDIAQEVSQLLQNTQERDNCLASLGHIQQILHLHQASATAASKIMDLV